MSEQKPKLLVVVDGQHIPYPTLDTFEPYQVTYQSYSGKPERNVETISKIMREFFLGGYHDIYYLGDNVSGLNDAGLFPIYWDDNGNALRAKHGVASADIGVFGGDTSILEAFADAQLVLSISAYRYFLPGQRVSDIHDMSLVFNEEVLTVRGRLIVSADGGYKKYFLTCLQVKDENCEYTLYEGAALLEYDRIAHSSIYNLKEAY